MFSNRFETFQQLHTHLESTHPDNLNSKLIVFAFRAQHILYTKKFIGFSDIVIDTKNIPLFDLNDARIKAAMKTFVDRTCDICHVKLDTLTEAQNHYLNEHKNSKGYFKCCESKLAFEQSLIDHLNWHANPNIFRYLYSKGIFLLLKFLNIFLLCIMFQMSFML